MGADYFDRCPNCEQYRLAVYEQFEINWKTMTITGNVYAECRNCFNKFKMYVREDECESGYN